MERREAEVWGLAAALAVNSAEEEQTALVAALREKILHTVQSARNPMVSPVRAEMKLRNVNVFLNGLVSLFVPDISFLMLTTITRVWMRQ